MFANRNEVEVTLGRSAEWEATVDEWAAIQSQNAGFMGATLLQSYANGGRYTLFSRWTDRDASIAGSKRKEFGDFTRSFLTSGLARPTRLGESYESVFEVDRENIRGSDTTAERWVDMTIADAVGAPAFEERMRQMAETVIRHAPGILSARLRRSMGIDTKYLWLLMATDRAAARGWLLVPEVRALREVPEARAQFSVTPSAEIFHVVKRYAGPAMAAAERAAMAATT